MNSFCVKCRKIILKQNDEQDFISKNGKPMKRGICAVCGTTKTRFVKGRSSP